MNKKATRAPLLQERKTFVAILENRFVPPMVAECYLFLLEAQASLHINRLLPIWLVGEFD
jgi:hypothetical protein